MDFVAKLVNISRKNKSLLCVGLDPDPELVPEGDILAFNKAIIDATHDLVCAYKPNLAFYEVLGIEGIAILEKTIKYIPSDIPAIGDAKCCDIGNTAKAYAKALFSTFGFDAATVSPYLGFDSVEPFINYRDKEVFLLCRTSNPSAADFQDLNLTTGFSLYEAVARKAKEWNIYNNIGLVVGATCPEELKKIRSVCPEMYMLIPGIGAQGGELASAVSYGVNAHGEKAIISLSRQILYASRGKDFAPAARNAAEIIRNQINWYLSNGGLVIE